MLGERAWRGPGRTFCNAIFVIGGVTAFAGNVVTAALLVWCAIYFPPAVRELVGLLLFGMPGTLVFLAGWRAWHLTEADLAAGRSLDLSESHHR